MIDRMEALKHCPVLSTFTEVGLKLLAESVRERVFHSAQRLQTQGEVPREQAVLFLASGTVRCEVRDAEGRVLGLGSLVPGDHLGAMRLLESAPAALTAAAEGEVVALALDRESFERLQRNKPQTAMKLLYALSADFGRRLAECATLFSDFAVYAGIRANLEERGKLPTYADLGLDITTTQKGFGRVR